MTLETGQRYGARQVAGGWELVFPPFCQRDGSPQSISRVFWPDAPGIENDGTG